MELISKEKVENKIKKSNSFHDWCIENNREDVLDRWDYDKNEKTPYEITHGTNKKYYIKCENGVHVSELKKISNFVYGQEASIKCFKCRSFAQYHIDNTDSDFLEKYWDYDKNKVSPWDISPNYTRDIYIKCQKKDSHGSYRMTGNNFKGGQRCSFCGHGVVHETESLDKKFPQVTSLWSDLNKESPVKYSPVSHKKVYWKCKKGKHGDYRRSVQGSVRAKFRCPKCSRERTESLIQEGVRKFILKSYDYTLLHEFECTIVPKNPKKKDKRGRLPFDNEIKELKLIIEVHSEYHYKRNGFHYRTATKRNTTIEQELKHRKLIDRYKRFVAHVKGYHYLEVPYWTINDGTYIKLIDDKINEISDLKCSKYKEKKVKK